jgi:hypothetical protein
MAQSLDIIATISTSYADFTTKARAAGYDLNDSSTGQKALDAWNKAKTKSSNSSNSNSQTGSIGNPIDIMKAGQGDSKISNMNENFKTGINNEFDAVNPKKINDAILKQLKLESDLHTEINEKMGLTGELSNAFRDSIIDVLPSAATLGYDLQNITDMVTTLSESTGKFSLIAANTLEQGFETARAFGMTLPQLSAAFGEFEKVGLGAADTLKSINAAGLQSLSLGLNSKKTTKDLTDNIGKLNEYGFKNGTDGLNRMVQKAAEFRMNMAETFKVADKVMDPSDAITLTANMQMLGGAVGDLNDPLKLMYMATNNVEGLQDAIQGAASTLSTYNKEQGRFEITGANLRRAKEMAAQLGVSYSEFAKGAIAAQERIVANDTLLAKGFNIDDKDREFLTNLSSMKDGEMQIVVPKSLQDKLGKDLGANELKLSELSSAQVEILKSYQKDLETKTPAEMAQDMFSATTKIANMTEATARALTTGAKNVLFGKELGRKGKDGNYEGSFPIGKLIETQKTLRKTEYDLTKDPNYMKSKVSEITGLVSTFTDGLTPAIDVLVDKFKDLNDELLKTVRSVKSKNEQDIEMENKRRAEMVKPENTNQRIPYSFNLKNVITVNPDGSTIENTSNRSFLIPPHI